MKIKAVDHITVNVKNLEETLRFYGEVLGFERLPDVPMDGQVIYYFRLPGGTRLELIKYDHDTGVSDGNELAVGSCRHFAFEVENIEETVETLRKAGYEFHLPCAWSYVLGCTCGLVRDPNGFELEFLQR